MAQTVYLVDADSPATGTPSGQFAWSQSFSSLQPALDVAGPDDFILVAEGKYAPNINDPNCLVAIDLIGGASSIRNYSFVVKGPTTIIGGYLGYDVNGSGSTSPIAPDGQPTSTILTGELPLTPGIPLNYSHHVIHIDGRVPGAYATKPVTIKHLNITSGNAYDTAAGAPYSATVGAGIYCRDAVLELDKVNISDCWADDSGAGIYITDGALRAKICVIRNNIARGNGAGIFLRTPHTVPGEMPDGWQRLSQMHNVQFLDNTAEGGAGLSATGPFPSWTDQGTGEVHPGLSVANCLFTRNSALWGAGAQIVLTGQSTDNRVHIGNCTFSLNTATEGATPLIPFAGYGGGLFVWDLVSDPTSHFRLHNSILKFNKGKDSNGKQVYSNLNIGSGTSPLAFGSITHCNIGPHPDGLLHNPKWQTLTNVIDIDPLFANHGMGAFQLQWSSPCVDNGNDDLLARDYLDLDNDQVFIGESIPRDLSHYSSGGTLQYRESNVPGSTPHPGILGVDTSVPGAINDLGCFEREPFTLPPGF